MTAGDLIGWALFGLVAGAIARFLHPGRDPMNWLWTMLLGIGGAVFGGWLAGALGMNAQGPFAQWVAAVIGAILLLAAFHFLGARSAGLSGPATNDDYKRAVFDDLSRGPNG